MDRDAGGGPDRPPGLILAGGRASRLGGGDKTLRVIGGRPLLARIVERLAPQCGVLVLSANGDPARFAPWAGPTVPDDPLDAGHGPLAGLLAGLDWVATHRPLAEVLLTLPGDTPFPPPDFAARLQATLRSRRATIAFARSGGRDHPLAALWSTTVREDLREALRSGGMRRVRDLHDMFGAVPVEWPGEPVDPFFNVNTPGDAAAAEHLAATA